MKFNKRLKTTFILNMPIIKSGLVINWSDNSKTILVNNASKLGIKGILEIII